MRHLTAKDCLCRNVKRVLEEDRPKGHIDRFVYAVFADDIKHGNFCGLATPCDTSLHPNWIFADLGEHRPLESVSPDDPLNKVLSRFQKTHRHALPVVSSDGYFIGAVTQESLLRGLLRKEHVLLQESRRLYQLAETDRKELVIWANRLSRLHEASRSLLNVLAHTALEDELLQMGIDSLAKLIDAKYGAIGILNAEGGLAQFIYTGISEDVAKRIGHPPEGKGILGVVIHDNINIRLEDMRKHPNSVGFPPGHPPMRSLLAVPISHASHVYGRIYLCDKTDGKPFSEADELLSMSFAHSLSLVLDNAREIEEIRSARQSLDYLAHFDTLTGLPNRELATDRIHQSLAQAHRHGGKIALLFIDLDNFKNVNDAYGHNVGDALLKAVAGRLSDCVRDGDTTARLSGDEFLVMLPDIEDEQDAAFVAQKVLDVLTKSFILDGKEIFVGASIGISIFPTDAQDFHELLRTADTAMYYAKNRGRNNYQFFTSRMTTAARRYTELEQHLRRAIEKNEFEILYQPQIESVGGDIVGVEALLRWNSEVLGKISPVEFIPVAEETGLIVPIGNWVLETACRQGKIWENKGLGDLKIAVNVSSRQFRDKNFINDLDRVLKITGLPPRMLELEITESLMMQDLELVMATFMNIHDRGIHLSVDDFGTGYSSLGYLKRFPINQLKIDKSFVQDIPQDENDMAIVQAIISMAKSLHMRVIAEGVETEEQLKLLQKFQCDEIQGFIFSKPVTPDSITEMMVANHKLCIEALHEQ